MVVSVDSRILVCERILYVLRLSDDCFYIGQSRPQNFKARMRNHFRGKGSAWTRLHHPIEIVEEVSFCGDYRAGEILENDKTLEYMRRYGLEYVRGGFFSNCDIEQTRKNLQGHGVVL